MEMKRKLLHQCTLTEDVQTLLLEYIRENDIEELENLLKEGRVDVNFIYKDEDYTSRNALQITCLYFSEDTNEKCIQLLLNYGADIYYEDPDTNKNSLHYAAESGNFKIFETILKYIEKKQLHIPDNIIYSLIKHIRDAELREENFVGILKSLLNTNVDINYQEPGRGWTSIYIAAKFKFKEFVKTMINMKKDEINLDVIIDQNKSARSLINDEKLYDKLPGKMTELNSNVNIFTLHQNIRSRRVNEFNQNFENIKHTLSDNEKYNLFNMAVKYRLEQVVEILLKNNVNYEYNYSNIDENPMILAAQRGNFKILKLFMKTKPNTDLVSKSIFSLLKSTATSEENENVNYQKCLTMLLKSEYLDINARDYNGNTAIHYALRYQDPEMTLKLLRKGATLASKDSFNRLAIADIDYLTLQTHLNECIRYENEEISTRDDACLVINFTSLLPAENNIIENKNDSENILIDNASEKSVEHTSDIFIPETEVLEYMCTSQELKQHLKHPVILTFLFLKWYRIAKFFYMNLSLYILFVLSLLCYITFGYNLKFESRIITDISYGILMFSFILLVIREISQIILYRHRYFLAFENWLEIVLFVATAGVLTEQSNETLMRQFSAIAIVAAAIEFLLLVGQFPLMSTNIMMLRTVSYTFFKLLLWYSILLFAFSYSFYTLFQEKEEEQHKNSTIVNHNNADDDEEQDFFENPGMSLLKTIVMLTGEFDAGTIKFDTYPVISHCIFVIFVFLIAIVLFNLLNGLAVSDTQIIKNDAELYGQILRVEHIAHIEKVLLTNKIIQWLPAIKKVCLFPLNNKKKEGFLYPNQNYKIVLMETIKKVNDFENSKHLHCFRIFFGIYLDKKIQQAIRSLMKDKKEEIYKKKKDDELLAEISDLKKLIQDLIKTQSEISVY